MLQRKHLPLSPTRWNPAGGKLFYLNGPRMMVVDIEAATAFRAGTPRELFEDPVLLATPATNGAAFQYGVAPDGQSFLFLVSGGGLGQDQQLRVVENWFEELRPLAPAD
jgi:hypothetical protein